MRIRQLDIFGFKSFVDKTTLHLPEGICAVVGPNGCGKSNIVDALRWVMGEQSVKQLRGKAMEDVIFSGSDKREPLNMAEVSLTLINDNGDVPEEYRHFSEIMLSRRIFRSGETGYFINKQPCRLKDIQNLLMGSGIGSKAYAIIEQGKIGTLIDAGPEERRFFIEEAAAITRYKRRKHEALLKIQRTRQNLLRINDVISEVKRHMNSLNRQAKKAQRYKTYQEQIEVLEVKLAAHQYATIATEVRDTGALLESLRDIDLKHGSELAKLDAAVEKIKEERAAKHQRISEEKAQRYDLQRSMDKLDSNIEYSTKDLHRLSTEIDQFKGELEELEDKDRQTGNERRRLEERKSLLQQDIQETKKTIKEETDAEEVLRKELGKLNQSLEANKAELVNLTSRKAAYQNTRENTSQNKQNLSKRLEQLKKDKEQTESELTRLTKEAGNAENRKNGLKRTLEDTAQALASLEEQLRGNREALRQQVREVQAVEIERQKARSQYGTLKKMDENYEWFRKGVQVIMKEWKSQHLQEAGICGLVADVIEPEPQYENAVEAALGEALQYVIVKDQRGGMTAIDSLRALSGGRSGFVPIRTLRPLENQNPGTYPTEYDLLVNHLQIREGYEDLMRALLGHVIVAQNLEEALRLWNQNGSFCTIVTQQGDRVCLQGILTGGSSENGGSGILTKKKKVKGLAKQIGGLEAAVAKAEARQKELETEGVTLETEVQKLRYTQNEKNQKQIQLDKELYRIQESLKYTNNHLEILSLEQQQMEGEQIDIEEELYKHQEVLAELAEMIQAKELRIRETKANVEQASKELEAAGETMVAHKVGLTTLQAEYDNLEDTLRRLTDFQRDRQDKLNRLRQLLRQAEEDKIATEQRLTRDRAKVNELYTELQRLEEKLAQSEAEYQIIEGALEQNDQALSEVRTRQQETLQKVRHLELKQSERRMKCDQLAERIRDKYQQDLGTLVQEHQHEGFSVEETKKALDGYREKIAGIGDVNLTAIQEHESLRERHELLVGQRDDLVDAIAALHRIIRKINRISLKQFMRTFKAVDRKVQTVFPKLFEGGTANLVLTNPRRPLESGVSFLVRPPGKRLTRMSLLSGGEKALAAIALIFSLFMIKPTTFCVLDEIDAPLDEVNVSRFNRLLREIGKESQVVMVTHDKQTMETANALFGVTMEQKGISKLVSLNLRGR